MFQDKRQFFMKQSRWDNSRRDNPIRDNSSKRDNSRIYFSRTIQDIFKNFQNNIKSFHNVSRTYQEVQDY